MRLHVHFTAGNTRIDEIVEGDNADTIVEKMRDQTAKQMGIIIGAFVRNMTPLQFAQEATRRYNAAAGKSEPMPMSTVAFLEMGMRGGFATRLNDATDKATNV